jgi:hypothetical protein
MSAPLRPFVVRQAHHERTSPVEARFTPRRSRAQIRPPMGRVELFVVFLTVLAVVAAAWFIKTGLWRRARLLLVTLAIFGGLGLLTRRLGIGELLVVAVLVLVPFFVLPARRPPAGTRR